MKKFIKKIGVAIVVFTLVLCLFPVNAFAFSWGSMQDTLVTGPTTIQWLTDYYKYWNNKGYNFTIEYDSAKHQQRVWDNDTKSWVTNSDGKYPYFQAEGDVPAEVPDTTNITRNSFIPYEYADKGRLVILSKDALSEACKSLNDQGITCSLKDYGKNYYCIMKPDSTVYVNSSGYLYVASRTPAAADNTFNYIVDNSTTDNSTTVENQIIDIGDKTMNVLNENGEKVTYNIDSLYFDESTHNYIANTYQVDYDQTNNYYTYNYYTWNITYNISNTYVTYIGSNDAYQQEEYKYYYELPDGRSSADLTADEIAGMSFQFHDMVQVQEPGDLAGRFF